MDELARFFSNVEYGAGCWLWKGPLWKAGYGNFRWQEKTWLANRLILVFAGEGVEEQDLFAIHRCGIPACVSPSHLKWGTARENHDDSVRHGTFCYGEKTGTAKMTAEKARAVYIGYHVDRLPLSVILRDAKISKTQLFRIINGDAWARETSALNVTNLRVGRAERKKGYRKLSDDDVLAIWNKWHTGGETQTSIAKQFKVTVSMISKVVFKRDYGDVTRDMTMLRGPRQWRKDGKTPSIEQLEADSIKRRTKGSVTHAKLSPSQAIEIWKAYHETDIRLKDLAEKYGVSTSTVLLLLSRKTWAEYTKGMASQRPFGRFKGKRHNLPSPHQSTTIPL